LKIYTIGFTKKTLEEFINRLQKAQIERVIDIRLNNTSQLAGFSKYPDFEFVLRQFRIEYISVKSLAPNKELLNKYHKDKNWENYEVNFKALMNKRNSQKTLNDLHLDKKSSCFLCTEDRPEKCHRRLVAEMLDKSFEIIHL
jgi:uncharacterized protein (DUF488 family)